MRAVIAFGSRVIFRLHKNRIVWTGLRAGFAADTPLIIKINDAIRAGVKCRRRTNFDTRRISAMIATHYAKKPSGIGKFALFDIFDPRPIYADGDLVLRFTRHRASVATDTFAVVYDETKIHCFFERLTVEI